MFIGARSLLWIGMSFQRKKMAEQSLFHSFVDH